MTLHLGEWSWFTHALGICCSARFNLPGCHSFPPSGNCAAMKYSSRAAERCLSASCFHSPEEGDNTVFDPGVVGLLLGPPR